MSKSRHKSGMAATAGAALLLALLPAAAPGQNFLPTQDRTPPSGPKDLPVTAWTPAKLADGQPDVQGFWEPDKQGTYSLTDPSNGGEGEVIRFRELSDAGKPVPKWPSRIIDPPDGQIPYQPWARERQRYIEANILNPTEQQFVDPMARCFPDGPVRNPLWTGFQIQQFPGYVVITFDQNHTYRVIPLDGRPHVPANIKLWMADSRGHWEGKTLVIDVANSNSKSRFDNIGDFASDSVHVTERLTFVDPNTISYEWRIEDPGVFTRPWTVWAKFNRAHKNESDWEQWEQACHEGEHNAESLIDGAANAN